MSERARPSPPRSPRPRAAAAGLAALGLAACPVSGCKDVTSFSTRAGENYCGSVVQGAFVRQGFSPAVQMRLDFDADKIEAIPGHVSTSDGLLARAELRSIPQIYHDPLSTMTFGEGRQRSVLYMTSPHDPAQGTSVTTIVSLLETGNVEVRLVRGAPASIDPAPPGEGAALFGVFLLSRQQGDCGFLERAARVPGPRAPVSLFKKAW